MTRPTTTKAAKSTRTIVKPIIENSRREAWKMAAQIMTSAKPMAAATVNHGRIWVTAGRISPMPPSSSTSSDKAHHRDGHVVCPGKIFLDRWQREKGFCKTDKQKHQGEQRLHHPERNVHGRVSSSLHHQLDTGQGLLNNHQSSIILRCDGTRINDQSGSCVG